MNLVPPISPSRPFSDFVLGACHQLRHLLEAMTQTIQPLVTFNAYLLRAVQTVAKALTWRHYVIVDAEAELRDVGCRYDQRIELLLRHW